MANNNRTFGELLRSLNNYLLKNRIRNIEKLNKKIVSIKNVIRFNETCIREGGLHPKFINIYIYIKAIKKDILNFSTGIRIGTYTQRLSDPLF